MNFGANDAEALVVIIHMFARCCCGAIERVESYGLAVLALPLHGLDPRHSRLQYHMSTLLGVVGRLAKKMCLEVN